MGVGGSNGGDRRLVGLLKRWVEVDLQGAAQRPSGCAWAVPMRIREGGRVAGEDEGGGSSPMWLVAWVDLALSPVSHNFSSFFNGGRCFEEEEESVDVKGVVS